MEKEMKKHALPVWEELPDFSVYRDQLIEIVQNAISVFEPAEDVLTPSMVNNYVKWGMVQKPVRKKYDREQIAWFVLYSLWKPVMSLSSIGDLIKSRLETESMESLYNRVCAMTEDILANAVVEEDGRFRIPERIISADEEDIFCATYALYFANRLRLKTRQKEEEPKQ